LRPQSINGGLVGDSRQLGHFLPGKRGGGSLKDCQHSRSDRQRSQAKPPHFWSTVTNSVPSWPGSPALDMQCHAPILPRWCRHSKQRCRSSRSRSRISSRRQGAQPQAGRNLAARSTPAAAPSLQARHQRRPGAPTSSVHRQAWPGAWWCTPGRWRRASARATRCCSARAGQRPRAASRYPRAGGGCRRGRCANFQKWGRVSLTKLTKGGFCQFRQWGWALFPEFVPAPTMRRWGRVIYQKQRRGSLTKLTKVPRVFQKWRQGSLTKLTKGGFCQFRQWGWALFRK